jgi:DNA-binding CsgD family transcriptional regulator
LYGIKVNNLSLRLLELIDRPIFISDHDSTCLECNLAFESLLELRRENILGQKIFQSSPASTAIDSINTEMNNTSILGRIYRVRMSNEEQGKESLLSIRLNNYKYYDDQGRFAGFIWVVNSMHEQVTLVNSDSGSGLPCTILTKRESEVLCLVSRGQTTKKIAITLGISSHTVADHMKSIFRKLGANNKVEAIVEAQKLRLL